MWGAVLQLEIVPPKHLPVLKCTLYSASIGLYLCLAPPGMYLAIIKTKKVKLKTTQQAHMLKYELYIVYQTTS